MTINKHNSETNVREKKALEELRKEKEKYKKSTVRYPLITSNFLLFAPKKFFNKYDNDVKKLVELVQTALSEANNAGIIAEAQSNPNNTEVIKQAYNSINHELDKIAQSKNINNKSLILKYKNECQDIIFSLVANEIVGYGPITPLFKDKRITEIIANGPYDIQIEVGGVVYKVESCHFRDKTHLQTLINRLYSSINKDVTRTNPIEHGRLFDNSRLTAVHEVIAPAGPNFNIRKHREEYWSPEVIIDYDTVNEEIMTQIGNWVYNGLNILIIGGTGTGKTSLLNSLTGFFRSDHRIITLEDNLELKPHPHKLFAAAMECVPPKPGAIMDKGITMRDLVKAGMRLRPDGIVIGEVADEAAYDLCQAMNTGHWGLSTLHANGPDEAMYRLMSLVSQSELVKGEAAYSLVTAFDIIITIDRMEDGSRKITSIDEIALKPTFIEEQVTLETYQLYEYKMDPIDYSQEKLKVTGQWIKKRDLSQGRTKKHRLNLVKELNWEELKKLSSV